MASATENRNVTIYINNREVENNIKSIRAEFRKLSNETNKLSRDTQEYEQNVKELQRVDGILRNHSNSVRQVESSWSRVGKEMLTLATGVGGGMLLTGMIEKLTQFIPDLVNRNAKLADSFANVAKTTGLTMNQVKQLSKDLKTIDTRSSRDELLKLAEEAGRLGKKSPEDILAFVKTADKLAVALGDDLGGAEAIRDVGKLSEQFKIAKTYADDFGGGMERLGSAINEVAASGSTQANYLVDFSKRLSGIAMQANISADEVLGYAAALDEAGQSSEVSGTVLSQLITGMFSDVAGFAQAAGLDVKEFTDLLNRDTNAALLKLIDGISGSNSGLQTLATRMNGLGLDGSRAVGVLSSLAGNLDKVREKQALASKAMTENTSLTNEFATKNENLAGNLEKVQKWMASIWTNGTILSGIEKFVAAMAQYVGLKVSDSLEDERVGLLMLQSQLNDTNLPQAERVRLIKELQDKYPAFLSNINAETVSNSELADSIAKINKNLVQKIIYQRKQEEIDSKANDIADFQELAAARELKLREQIVTVADRNNIKLKDGLTITEQAQALIEQLGFGNTEVRYMEDRMNQVKADALVLENMMGKLNVLQGEASKIQGEVNKTGNVDLGILKDKTKLLPAVLAAQENSTTKNVTLIETNKKALDELAKSIQKVKDALKEAEADDPALELLTSKNDALLSKIQDAKDAKAKADAEFKAEMDKSNADWFEGQKQLLEQGDSQMLTHYDLWLEQFKEKFSKAMRAVETAAAVNNQFNSILAQLDANKTTEYENNRKREMAALDTQLSRGIISQEAYNKKKDQIEKSYHEKTAELQTKAFERNKHASAVSAGISAAVSIVKALELGPIAGPIAASIIGALALAQVAAIESAPTPEYAKGGFLTNGASHANGGIALVDSATNRKVGEVEGGEPILSRATYANNRTLVDALLNSSQTRNGANILGDGFNFDAANRRAIAQNSFSPALQNSASSSRGQENDGNTELARAVYKLVDKLGGSQTPGSTNAPQIVAKFALTELEQMQKEYDGVKQLRKLG